MNLRRLRRGELTALAGAVALLVVLFLPWTALAGEDRSGWASLGVLTSVLAGILIAGGLSIAFFNAREWPVAWMVGSAVLTVGLGGLIALVLLVRVLLQPGEPNDLVDVKLWAWAGVALAALVPAGAWMSLDDERTAAPEAAYTPPPPRPVPGTPTT
jgi:hypothetical protein